MATINVTTRGQNFLTNVVSAVQQAGGRITVTAGDGNTYECFKDAAFNGSLVVPVRPLTLNPPGTVPRITSADPS